MNTAGDDTAADAHLRAALRHAPDADIGAPADLSAQIIAAGHRAAAEQAPQPRRKPSWWQTPWALGGSGAFATLLLAGFLGLLWRGETPGPAREEAPAAAAPASAVLAQEPAQAAATVAAAPAPPTRAAETGAQGRVARRPATRMAAAAPTAQAQPDTTSAAPAAKPDARLAPGPAAPAPAAAVAAPVHVPAALPAPVPAAVPAAAPAAGPAPAPVFVPPPPAPAAVSAMADAARATQVERQALAAPSAEAPRAMRAPPRPEAPWLAAMADGLAVQWRLDGVERPAPSSWLYALATQAQGRWTSSTHAPAAGERSVQWQQGERVLGRLWLNADRVLACDAQARCQQAVLAPDMARELLKNMPR